MGQLVKQFINHFGLDLKSNEIVRDPRFASDIQNAQYKKNGNIGKRQGFRAAADPIGGYGAYIYERVDPVTGVTDDIIVTVDDNLYRLNSTSFEIAYSGSELSAVVDLFFDEDSGEYKLQITEGETLVLDTGLDIAVDELSPKTLAALKIEIDALTDFSATITGTTSIPAAYLEFIRGENIAGTSVTTTAEEWVQINSPLGTVFAEHFANRQDFDYENMSFAQANNVLYMIAKDVDLHKFDGQNVYKAGLPVGPIPAPVVAGGGLLSSTYAYQVRYAQFDNVGNLVESMPSDDSVSVSPSAQSVNVTVNTIEDTTGFNTNAAVVNGLQATTNTINVDDGAAGTHTLQVGDKAYFFDDVANAYTTRNVTARTSTSITVDGAAVTVQDNIVISNNLRIGIYRNVAGGESRFLVEEIPNNPFVSSVIYNDNVADADLGIELIEPDFVETAPPRAIRRGFQ